MDDIEFLKSKYNLDYHVEFTFLADDQVGLRGKRVLEIGGSLPRDFALGEVGAAQWVAVEETQYYESINVDLKREHIHHLQDIDSLDLLGDYAIVSARAEKLTPAFFNSFDVIFSLSAFEHIDRFPAALNRMHQTLKPGGRLFSMFSPIWSSRDGHHLHPITDKSGNTFSFANSPIPPWGHLVMRPPQMYQHLLSHTDEETAAEIVYNIYNSTAINRLFTEDYVDYFHSSFFEINKLASTFPEKVPENIQSYLERAYPGRVRFDNQGLLVVLTRST